MIPLLAIYLAAKTASDPTPLPSTLDHDAISAQIADRERDGTYQVDPIDGALKAHLVNRAEGIRVYVDDRGGFIVADRNDTSRRVRVQLREASPSMPSIGDDSVRHEFGGIHQSWQNITDGIEHTIVVDNPVNNSVDELRLHLDVSGAPVTITAADGAVFEQSEGSSFYYRGLYVYDAQGQRQTAWFEEEKGALVIAVEFDANAEWPITVDPIIATPYRTLVFNSQATNSQFGAGMAIGDFNRDGITDLAVAANLSKNSQTDSGFAEILLGDTSSAVALTSQYWSFDPHTTGARCGVGLGAGDLDGANGDDIVVLCAGTNSLKIFLNTSSGLPGFATFSVPTSGFVSSTGPIVSVVDLDGDGKNEVILVSSQKIAIFQVNSSGTTVTETDITGNDVNSLTTPRVYKCRFKNTDNRDDLVVESGRKLFFFEGQATGLLTSTASRILDFSSWSVISFAPIDHDGDGASDLLIGEKNYSSGAGRVLVDDNNGSGTFTISTAATVLGSSGEHMGTAVLGADVNKDGFEDLIACGVDAAGGKGACRVIGGGPRSVYSIGFDSIEHGQLVPLSTSVGMGDAPLIAGDFLADLGLDVAVPSAAHDTVSVFDGDRTNIQTSPTHDLVSARQEDAALGESAILLFDLDGDGHDDLIAGAPEYDAGGGTDGCVFTWLGGSPMDSIADWQVCGSNGERLGAALAAGHFKGNGAKPALAVGAPDFNQAGPDKSGRIKVWFMPSSGLPANFAAQSQTFVGAVHNRLGAALANVGTAVLAGGDSVAAGAPGDGASSLGGEVDLFTWSSSGLSGLGALTTGAARGCSQSAGFGSSIAGVGNIDGSQRDDFVIADEACSASSGKAWLYTSCAVGCAITGVHLSSWEFSAKAANVARVGDINGDGRPDFAVGAPTDDGAGSAGSERGKVFLFSGVSSGTPSVTPFASITRAFDGAHFGAAIAGGVDINVDGFDDMIIGSPDYTQTNSNEGRIDIFVGGSSISQSSYYASRSGCTSCRQGAAVAAGEVNGEIHGDVAFSRPGGNLAGYPGEGMVYVRIGAW